MPEPLLEVSGLTVEFGAAGSEAPFRALDDVSFQVAAGESVGIVGESGSGKTITLRTIGGLPSPATRIGGEVFFEGRSLLSLRRSEARAARRQMGAIFQNPRAALDPVFTVGSQLVETLKAQRHMRSAEANAVALDLLEAVGIPEPRRRMKEYPHAMSGGMAQRVTIALALACSPRLLLADEPTSALDVSIQAQIVDLLGRTSREQHMGLLFISHDLGAVAELCERVIVMYAGRIVEMGPTADVIASPVHPYTAGLISAVPRLRSEAMDLDRLPFVEIPTGTGVRPDVTESRCNFVDRCVHAASACRVTPARAEPLGVDRMTRCIRAGELSTTGVRQ